MFRSVKTLIFVLAIMAFLLGSCGENEDISDPTEGGELEDDLEIEIVPVDETDVEDEIETRVSYPIFASVIEEKGYRVMMREAACYKAYDKGNDRISNLTMIPCRRPESDESAAMIYYYESEGEYLVTAAEYFKDEGYEISHPLDMEALENSTRYGLDGNQAMRMTAEGSNAQAYWQCVTKGSVSTCIGCSIRCYLAGPGWAHCTTTCCATGLVVAIFSCLFTIYRA